MKPQPDLRNPHGFKIGAMWPRAIAKGFVEQGKDAAWVWKECKKHEYPTLIWQWVTDLITMMSVYRVRSTKQLGDRPDD